jgi:DNA modification methylase
LRDYKNPVVNDVFAVGGLGLEGHPKRYVERMVVLCRLLKRVLKKSGSLWIVIDDTYFGSGGNSEKWADTLSKKESRPAPEICITNNSSIRSKWLQPKQRLLIPERVAIGLQEDGWTLRNDCVWFKPNHMPESVKDRLSNSWEHVYFFVKSRRYFFDLDAVRKPINPDSIARCKRGYESDRKVVNGNFNSEKHRHWAEKVVSENSYEGKFEGSEDPEAFGSPRARTQRNKGELDSSEVFPIDPQFRSHSRSGQIHEGINSGKYSHNSLGVNPSDLWSITTRAFKEAHFAVYPEQLCELPIKAACPKDGVVLDPMCGSGTTCLVARKLCRNYIGIELNPSYVEMARKRLATIPERLDKLEKLLEKETCP